MVDSSYRKEEETLELKEAAKFLHLSEDRLYAILATYFDTLKQRKKLLFNRSELISYLHGKLPQKVRKEVSDAKEYSIKRLENKMKAVQVS